MPHRRRRAVARASALLVGLTAGSQVLGFVRDAWIAAVYGLDGDLDAYFVAQGLMNLVLGLIAGAVAKATVPTVARAVAGGRTREGHRTVRVVLTVTTFVLVVGSALVAVGAEAAVSVLAPGFDGATLRATVDLSRIVLVATVFIAGTNVLVAAAQSHGRFFWGGVQGVPFNLVMIAAVGVFGPRYGVTALAVGFVVGSLARYVTQLPAAHAIGLRLTPSLHLRDPGAREVLRLVPPLVVGSAVGTVNTLVDRAVGSLQGEGTIAALGFGWRLVTLVDVLLVTAVAATLFPAFSAAAAPERRAELGLMVDRALSVVVVCVAPGVVLFCLVGEHLVALAFGRGNVDPAAVSTTGTAVAFYAPALLGLAVREVAARACYAVGDSRTPVRVAVVAVALNVAGDLTVGVHFGVAGLAGSTSVSLLAAAVLLLWSMHRRHGLVGSRHLLRSVVGAGAGVLVSTVAVLALNTGHDGSGSPLVVVSVAGTVCGLSYLGTLAALRVPALGDVRHVLRDVASRRRRDGSAASP